MTTNEARVGTVHPIIKERVLWLAMRVTLVAAPDDENRNCWSKLLREVTAHLLLVRHFVAHDEHL